VNVHRLAEAGLAREARTLRKSVATYEAELRDQFRAAASALGIVLQATEKALDIGEALVEARVRLAAAERVLHPEKRVSVGRFRLHPMLVSLLVGGDAALDWLQEAVRE